MRLFAGPSFIIICATFWMEGMLVFSILYPIFVILVWRQNILPVRFIFIMAGLYFHIPFCKRICAYCDFYRSADLRLMDDVMAAMSAELEEQREYLRDRQIRTIYFGGGTPSLLEPAVMGELVEQAAALFDCSAVEEFTVEANPDDITQKYAAELRRVGVNRVSLGVQSFDDAELRFMNRRHTAEGAEKAVRVLQDTGFDNITVDLIFGVDGFSQDVLRRSVERVLALDVQHVSAYHLTIEPATAFGRRLARGEMREVVESQSEREYALIEEMLCGAGFEHYEVSNYAKAGRRSRHNSSYWHQAEYLGIGPGAHSFNGVERHWSEQSLGEYIARREYVSEILTEQDFRNECVMTSLRCAEGIDMEYFSQRFGAKKAAELRSMASRWIASGDVVDNGERIYIPTSRFLISDAVIESLFEV